MNLTFVHSSWNFDPIASGYIQVGHEANLKVNVTLVGAVALHAVARKIKATLEHSLGGGYILGQDELNAQELRLLIAVKSVDVFFGDELNVEHNLIRRVLVLHLVLDRMIQRVHEPVQVGVLDTGGRCAVQIRHVAVEMSHDAVAVLVHAVQTKNGNFLRTSKRFLHWWTCFKVKIKK